MSQTTPKIISCLGELLELEKTDHIKPETRLAEDLDLDSSLFIELLMVIEDHFEGIVFDPENLKQDDFSTVASLSGYVESLIAAN